MTRKLTDKQKAFIDAYCSVSKYNATDAARRAGYKHPNKQGPETLVKLGDEVSLRMQELQKKSGASIMNQQELAEFFSNVTKGKETEKVVANTGKVVEVPVSMKDRIKTAELLGKSYGMFVDKKEVSGNLDIDIGVGEYDDDD
ncbi:terminase small subunit [uncultured Lentilactobacillus sp.]|uniref:terminase small subunit n=1 Tax=uncultured Lentilactobacillus sp. TaxID=2805375 RepID=UPI0025991371|nr:terminase small subunit [uncultured Lentilactobacillus sp.]